MLVGSHTVVGTIQKHSKLMIIYGSDHTIVKDKAHTHHGWFVRRASFSLQRKGNITKKTMMSEQYPKMIVYMRHAEDVRCATCPKHDTPITQAGATQAQETALDLCERYGFPSVILCSPYLRTRQTAHYMQDELVRQTGITVPVYIDTLLSKYVSSKEMKRLGVRADTLMYKPPLHESKWQLQFRVKQHLNGLRWRDPTVVTTTRRADDGDDAREAAGPVWCLTHGIVVRYVAKMCGMQVSDHVDGCGWVPVHV